MSKVTPETWKATLSEVSRQIQLLPKPTPFSQNDTTSSPSTTDKQNNNKNEDWIDILPQPANNSPSSSTIWPQQQWFTAFDILFCQLPPSIAALRQHQDDLLFFVYLAAYRNQNNTRIFARRRTTTLPADLQPGTGAKHNLINWKDTLLLNLVLQTDYTLTVCRCPETLLPAVVGRANTGNFNFKDLQQQQQHTNTTTKNTNDTSSATTPSTTTSTTSIEGFMYVTKKVHASPSRVPVNMDESKPDGEPEVSYPDVCFVVDDFTETFKSMVLAQGGDCYCVLLHAQVGHSWRQALHFTPSTDRTTPEQALANLSLTSSSPSQKDKNKSNDSTTTTTNINQNTPSTSTSSTHPTTIQQQEQNDVYEYDVPVFNGYVSHTQLTTAISSRPHDPLGFLFSDGGGSGRDTVRMLMHGPDGLGNADVAVTSYIDKESWLEEQQQKKIEEESEEGSSGGEKKRFGGGLFRKVANVVKRIGRDGGGEDMVLQCALMTLAVPVDMLAEGILESLC